MKSGDHGNSHFDEEIAPVAPAAGAFLLAIINRASAHLELGQNAILAEPRCKTTGCLACLHG